MGQGLRDKARKALQRNISELRGAAAPAAGLGLGLGMAGNGSSGNLSHVVGGGAGAVVDIQQLRVRVAEREEAQKALAAARVRQQDRHIAITRVYSLSTVCDSLRSLWLSQRNASHAVAAHEVLRDLAPAFGITEVELLTRLRIISREFPEFLSIFQADAVLNVPTIRVNLRAPYVELGRKVAQWVGATLQAIEAKFAVPGPVPGPGPGPGLVPGPGPASAV